MTGRPILGTAALALFVGACVSGDDTGAEPGDAHVADAVDSTGSGPVLDRLFELEEGLPGDAFYIVSDADYLYWFQRGGRLHRGDKDGNAKELLGQAEQGQLVADDTSLYSLSRVGSSTIFSVRKAGGQVHEFEPLPGELLASVNVDATHVYFATDGCAQVGRWEKPSGPVETLDVDTVDTPIITKLVVDDGDVYCASGSAIYLVRGWEAPAEVFVSDETNIGALTFDASHVYWLNNDTTVVRPHAIGWAPKSGGSKESFLTDQPGTGRQLHVDVERRRVYWVTGEGVADVASFNPDTRTLDYLAQDRQGKGSITGDDDFLYWTEASAIMRLRKE